MFFCNFTISVTATLLYFKYKSLLDILLKQNKENFSNIFLKKLLHLKILSSSQPPLQKVILHPGKYLTPARVSKAGWWSPNRNIYIFEIWLLVKTYSQKLGYTLKLVILVCSFDRNVSCIERHKNKQQSQVNLS